MKNTLKGLLASILLVGFMSACSITVPVAATSNAVGSKVGKQKATVFFMVLAFNQDASIMSAAKNGGITKISTVDMKQGNILGLIQTYETIVTGE
jgi:hypothetical protein